MLRKSILALIMSASLLTGTTSSAYADDSTCLTLGGASLSQAVDSTNFIGTITGPFSGGARAEVLAETKNPTGLTLKMEHFFITNSGGLLRTKDTATLTTINGKNNVYMLEINYDIEDATGILEGYEGEFQSTGLIDFDTGRIVLRYEGEICK